MSPYPLLPTGPPGPSAHSNVWGGGHMQTEGSTGREVIIKTSIRSPFLAWSPTNYLCVNLLVSRSLCCLKAPHGPLGTHSFPRRLLCLNLCQDISSAEGQKHDPRGALLSPAVEATGLDSVTQLRECHPPQALRKSPCCPFL